MEAQLQRVEYITIKISREDAVSIGAELNVLKEESALACGEKPTLQRLGKAIKSALHGPTRTLSQVAAEVSEGCGIPIGLVPRQSRGQEG